MSCCMKPVLQNDLDHVSLQVQAWMMVILQPADIAISRPVHSRDLSIRISDFQGEEVQTNEIFQ